jgi:CxxC motif-containing protein
MRQELTCITCPMGCRLSIERPEGSPDGGAEGEMTVTGNRCPRGAAYAREELLAPKRTVTATCRVLRAEGPGPGGPRRLPCRTRAPFPKERVNELLEAIYALEVSLPVERGAVLIRDALGLGIDVVAARTLH